LIFLDTSFIVAFANSCDSIHKKASILAEKIDQEEKVVSYVIILKVLNILRKSKEGKLNQDVYRFIKDNFKIYLRPERIL